MRGSVAQVLAAETRGSGRFQSCCLDTSLDWAVSARSAAMGLIHRPLAAVLLRAVWQCFGVDSVNRVGFGSESSRAKVGEPPASADVSQLDRLGRGRATKRGEEGLSPAALARLRDARDDRYRSSHYQATTESFEPAPIKRGRNSTAPAQPSERTKSRSALATLLLLFVGAGCEAKRFTSCDEPSLDCPSETQLVPTSEQPSSETAPARLDSKEEEVTDPVTASADGADSSTAHQESTAASEPDPTSRIESSGVTDASGKDSTLPPKSSPSVDTGPAETDGSASSGGTESPAVTSEGVHGQSGTGPGATDGAATTDGASTTDSAATTDEGSSAASLPVGVNLLTNGDFSDGREEWTVESGNYAGFGQVDSSDGMICVRGFGASQVVVGWPRDARDALVLPGGRYTFAFRVQGDGGRLWAKVGHAYEPYQTLFEVEWTGDNDAWSAQEHAVTLDSDDAVGVAFTIQANGETVCLDDASLTLAAIE